MALLEQPCFMLFLRPICFVLQIQAGTTFCGEEIPTFIGRSLAAGTRVFVVLQLGLLLR